MTTASEPIVLDAALDFMRLLWNVEHGLLSRSKWMETTLGITGPQRLVPRIVVDRPGLAATELAHILHLSLRHVELTVCNCENVASVPDAMRVQGSGSRSARTRREA